MTILTIKDMYTDNSGDFSCSLYKLQLKFVQTTRVVCTDFAEVLTLGNAGIIFSSYIERLCRMR